MGRNRSLPVVGARLRNMGASYTGAAHLSSGARSAGCEGQLKRWATVWLVRVAVRVWGIVCPPQGLTVGLDLAQWPNLSWERADLMGRRSSCSAGSTWGGGGAGTKILLNHPGS